MENEDFDLSRGFFFFFLEAYQPLSFSLPLTVTPAFHLSALKRLYLRGQRWEGLGDE